MSQVPNNHAEDNSWPHRMAVLLVCAVFPLIWVGGLVTTYDAGMAVPDWPSTYGYNLLLYPWQTWLSGPWDLFIEHGHRLLGALVGALTIALAAVIYRYDGRSWMRWMGLLCVLGVIGQGVLGGMRVLKDERSLARIHGCTGPIFFAFCVALAVMTSRWWKIATGESALGSAMRKTSWAVVAVVVCQLLLGANLRHVTAGTSHRTYSTFVMSHVTLAVLLVLLSILFSIWVWMRHRTSSWLVRPTAMLLALLVAQFGLGVASWIGQYGVPLAGEWNFVVEANGLVQSMLVTAHVAVGSLILATATCVALRSTRAGYRPTAAAIPISPSTVKAKGALA